jgi:hypothetical protein
VSIEEFDPGEGVRSGLRSRAYEAVAAVVSDDHNDERGIAEARAVADTVRTQAGADGLAELVVELSLKLAEALEQIAAEQGLAAEDLAEVWFAV